MEYSIPPHLMCYVSKAAMRPSTRPACCVLCVCVSVAAKAAHACASRPQLALRHYSMDFVPVAAGVAPAVALTNRGADHDLDLASADEFISTLGEALHARAIAGARSRVCYSAVSGVMSGHFFTRDPAVLALALKVFFTRLMALYKLWMDHLIGAN